jgi:outer membrane cobalamin receptor
VSIAHAQDDGNAVELQEIEIEADSITQSNADTSEAVNFIDTALDRRLTADLGEVLARTPGVAVRPQL